MIFLVLLAVWAIWFLFALAGTGVIVWAMNEIMPGADTPFWPVFWILVVLIVLVRGGSASSKD